MANKLNKDEIGYVQQLVDHFNSDNTVAKQASSFSQPASNMQQQGDTVWRDTPMIATTTDGLDITGNIGSVTDLQVPSTLSTIANVPWELNVLELRNPEYATRKARAAAQALSARINRSIAGVVNTYGSLTVAQSGLLSGYDDVSLVDALMHENDLAGMGKTMVLNPRDYNRMAGDLAKRTLQPRSDRALTAAELGDVANFNTYSTSFATPVAAAAGGATTVTGSQRYVPVATSTAATGETAKVDNRTMPLTVSNTAGVAAGDKFTIAGVNAVSHINKADTQQLKTFSVVSVIDGTNLQVSPPIIVGDGASDAEDDLANCSAVAAGAAALTWLNTTAAQSNVFFMNDSIEVFGGTMNFDEGAGVAVERMMTDSGIEIVFAKSTDILTGKTTYRQSMFYGVTNLNPEANGILIGGQV